MATVARKGNIRVMLVDDHAVLRAGLRMLIDQQEDMEVVGEAAGAKEALALLSHSAPNVVLLDLTLEGEGGIGLLPRIRRLSPDVSILVLTVHAEKAYLRAALDAGAAGYVVKSADSKELLAAIRRVARGGHFVDRSLGPLPEPSARPAGSARVPGKPLDLLSARELQVFSMVARGFTNREIATAMDLSVKTIESYRARVMEKLELGSRADLVRFALDCGILRPGTEPDPGDSRR